MFQQITSTTPPQSSASSSSRSILGAATHGSTSIASHTKITNRVRTIVSVSPQKEQDRNKRETISLSTLITSARDQSASPSQCATYTFRNMLNLHFGSIHQNAKRPPGNRAASSLGRIVPTEAKPSELSGEILWSSK
jgi:hypothetical protein